MIVGDGWWGVQETDEDDHAHFESRGEVDGLRWSYHAWNKDWGFSFSVVLPSGHSITTEACGYSCGGVKPNWDEEWASIRDMIDDFKKKRADYERLRKPPWDRRGFEQLLFDYLISLPFEEEEDDPGVSVDWDLFEVVNGLST